MSRKPIVVTFPFIGDEVGGSHISAINLISGLNTEEIKPLVVIHDDHEVLSEYLDGRGIPYLVSPRSSILSPVYRVPGRSAFGAGFKYLASVPSLIRFLKEHRTDVVHTNDGRMHATWALPARLSGARLLWHHRGDPAAKGANMLAPLLANQIVTVSHFAKPSRPILPIDERVTVIHSPFDHPSSIPEKDDCRMTAIRELGLARDARFVGYFGGLIERKRPLLFVEAVAAHNRRFPQMALHGLLFGQPEAGGPPFDKLVMQRAAELGISAHIHLMGFRSPVAPFMRAVDILLVPAVGEPFGRTIIEAMLLGTPVIATNHGGNPEAIRDGENGRLVAPENPEAFVEPIHRLMADPCEWKRISDTARAEALVNYGTAAHIDGITRIYEKLVGRR